MTNPTLEQRAREILSRTIREHNDAADDNDITIWPDEADVVVRAMLTFSHTGVEQAIEACAKDGWVMVPREPTDDMLDQGVAVLDGSNVEYVPPSRVWAAMVAVAPPLPDTNPLPAQSPDDIAPTNLQKTQIAEGEGDGEGAQDFGRITLRHNIKAVLARTHDLHPEYQLEAIMSAIPRWAPTPSPVNVEGLVAAVDAWMNNPCPETEQLIMDARGAQQPRSERE